MTRQTTRLTQLTIIVLLLTILVGSPPAEARPPAAPALQTITVNLENFGGEGSFRDGYDFSAQAVQRYGEEGPDRPELAPDFYYLEGYPIAGPIGFDIVNTIDFGAVGLETVTTAPDPADPRFGQNTLSFGHTYGLYTLEGQFVAFQVTNVYQEPYDDWHIEGITIVWKQLGAPPVGDLEVTVGTYQTSYALGEHPTIHGVVTADGQPVEGVWVTIWLFDQQGNTLWGLSIQTSEGGGYLVPVTYGEEIPTGYSGWLTVTADVTHQEAQAHATTTFGYAVESGEGLELTLNTGKNLYLVDEEVRITLRATFDDEPVQGVYVTFRAYDEAGAQLASVYAETDANGEIESNLTLPGQQGVVRITAEGEYGLSTASAERRITFGPSTLTLELTTAEDANWGPGVPIEVGASVGFGGRVTYLDQPVEDAAIQITVRGQTYRTQTFDDGSFAYYLDTGGWPAGEYVIQVTASLDGFGVQPATGAIPFTLIGDDYIYWVTLNPINPTYPLQTTVTFGGLLTLGGGPVSGWVEVYITRPDGEVDGYSMPAGDDGHFSFEYTPPLEGDYTLIVHNQQDGQPISQVYTFAVGATPTPTVTPSAPQPTQVTLICEITDVVYPSIVFVGENVEITGKVVCTEGYDGEEIIPQEGWDIHVYGNAPYKSPVKAPVVQTSGDGSFAATLTPQVFYIQELIIGAHDPEIETRYARWFGPLSVVVGVEPDITLSQTDYDQGEIVEGKLELNPSSPARDWDSGLEIYYQITGPVDGAAKQYLFESEYYYADGVDRFYWSVPHDAGAGKFTLTAYISGRYIATQTVEVDFYVTDIRHTNLTAVVEPAPDGWSSASLVGQFTDFEGVPIPNADVRVVFYEILDDEFGNLINQTREFNLTGTTDEFGNFEINLEPLDLFAGRGQEDPWLDRYWSTTVYADKDGYATGAAIIQVRTPTVKPRIEIISVNPPLDHLSKLAQGGLSYEQLTEMNIQVRVRYNNIFGDGAKLAISTQGNWGVDCIGYEPGVDPVIHEAHLSINGEQKPRWETYAMTPSAYQNMLAWHFPWSGFATYRYYYPAHRVNMPAQQGIAQESTFTVSGRLFGYRYSEDSPHQCGGSAYGTDSPGVPPSWVGAQPAVSIGVSLGRSSAVVYYNITPPSISASGTAWVSPTGGEFKGNLYVGQATGFTLHNQQVNLSIIAKDIDTGEEKPTSEIAIQSSASTDDKGELNLPLTAKTNPCKLEEKATYYVKITSPVLDGEQKIPIQLRCIETLNFELSDANISVVQVIDLSDNSSIQLVANKEAGVRVYMFVDGEIYQPTNRPVQFDVKFEMLAGANNTPLFPQIKTVSLSEKGVSVSWSSQSRAINDAGIGEILTWETTPNDELGRELVYVDFVFTPREIGGSNTKFQIKITVDPDEIYGEKVTAERPVTVKKMKHLQILFVPVDVQNVDMSLVWQQVSFLQETYPLGGGDLGWGIASNYPSADMPFKWTTSYLDQICAALTKRYGSAGGGAAQFRIVGLIHPDTWRAGIVDKWVGVDTALGVHFESSPQVVLLKHAANEANTMAHELGHSYGLYLGTEQYDSDPPNGRAVSGLMLRNSKIYNIPSNRSDPSQLQWIGAFGGNVKNYQKLVDSGRKYNAPMDVFGLMGNARGAGQKSWIDPDTYHHLFDKLKDPPGDDVLLVQGLVNENFDVILEPTWSMPGLPDPVSDVGDYTLQLISSNGDVLYETRFGEKYTAPNSVLPFFIQIPWIPGIDRVRILDGDLVKAEQLRTPNPPQFETTPTSMVGDEAIIVLINWSASDPDGDALTYSLHYQCDNTSFWFLLASDILENNYTFDASGLPGGESCVVRVMASDGFNTAEIVTDPFFVLPKVADVHIFVEETPYDAESAILLKGMASDPEDGILPNESLRWFSDIDGELGVGSAISVMLSPGTHNLTLRAQDSAGNFSLANATIQVQSGEILTGMGSGLQSLWLIGFVALAALLGMGALFFIWLVLRKRRQPVPVVVQGIPGQQPGTVQDKQGRWWYQDPNTGRWHFWNGQTWQVAQMGPAVPPSPTSQTFAARPEGKGCLLSIIVVGIMSALVIGGVTLVAFKFFSNLAIQPASTVSVYELLKNGGGGLLLTLLGTLLLRGGFKSIATRRAIVEDELGRRREKRGCSAILNGLGQVFLGLILLIAGLGMIALALYQQLLPLLGYSLA